MDLKFQYSSIKDFTNRIMMFDQDNLQIRAHLFYPGAADTFIHDHQFHFISYCLQGSYNHQLYTVLPSDTLTYYTLQRRPGGIYNDSVDQHYGIPTRILDQQFQAGQCMFLNAHASHTVSPNPGAPVITITFRDKRNIKNICTVMNTTRDFGGQVPSIDITDPMHCSDLLGQLQDALKCNYGPKHAPKIDMVSPFAKFVWVLLVFVLLLAMRLFGTI